LPDSPIFVHTYDLLLWLVPRTLKFPREHRFGLAQRIQGAAFALQRAFVEAALADGPQQKRDALHRADVELSELRLNVRLSHDLRLLDDSGYRHVSQMLREVGNLLGGWQRSSQRQLGTEGQP
jgi:four helix bundle protein